MSIQKIPPLDQQAEVSLFGPGYGECLVIHYGNNDWFIIDSCLDPQTKRPISLVYLEEIGVDPSNVKGLLLTHWHSDHTSGASEIVKKCPNAKVYFSVALSDREAFNLAYLYDSEAFSGVGQDIKEFKKVADYLFETNQRHRLSAVKAGHSFFNKNIEGITSKMLALSPSNTSVTWALTKLSQQIPKSGSARVRNIVPDDPNYNAVALHFNFGEISVLLGADLEESGNPDTGWSAILNSNMYGEQDLSKSRVFKVPHHGSSNGHHDDVWNELLLDKPISITTPYNKLEDPLPTDIDRERIINLSESLSVTKKHTRQKPPKKGNNTTERMLKSIVKDRVVINNKMGHIQIRFSCPEDLSLETCENVVSYSCAS